jgi:hypothetical protein
MSQRVQIARIKTNVPYMYVEFVVHYDKGHDGSYVVDNPPPRGIKFLCMPVEVKGGMETRGCFTGRKFTLEVTKRFNPKQLREAAEKAKSHPMYAKMIREVFNLNGYTPEEIIPEVPDLLPVLTEPSPLPRSTGGEGSDNDEFHGDQARVEHALE